MSTKAKLGYIGLGLMGKPMALNLLKAGFEVVVHNRSRAAVQDLVAAGAKEAHSPKEVAEQVDIVFTNLPDSPDVELVALGPDGIIAGAHEGLIFIDHSTIKPATARHIADELSKKGVRALDAPVSGGDFGAQQGTLTIMVGGDESALEQARPALEAMGKAITHIGEAGAGQVAKCCNQIMVAAQMAAMGELLIFARKADVDPEKVVAAIRGGAAQCWALDTKPDKLFAGDRQPGFKAYMQAKDLGIVMETAEEYNMPLPAATANTEYFNQMLELGMADLDNSAVVGVVEKLANMSLVD
jgi:2-hydroxy-3-oxopropionate reductase